MHTSIAASLLASCVDCVCEIRPSSFWSVSLLLSAVAADDENEAIFLPEAKMAINSVLPAPKIFRNDYSKLQSHGTEYKCILSRCDAVIDEIAAAKIDTQTPCRCQVYRPRLPRSLPRDRGRGQKAVDCGSEYRLSGVFVILGDACKYQCIYITSLHAMNTTV